MSDEASSVPSQTDWERIDRMTDGEIDFSDAPALTAEFFEHATWRTSPIHVSVSVDALPEGDSPDRLQLTFAVRDTGPGIAPELSGRVFESFVQGDGSLTREHGGMGLGLAIAKRLVELMGGAIGFTSQMGQGTEFRFSVRARRSAEGPRQDCCDPTHRHSERQRYPRCRTN